MRSIPYKRSSSDLAPPPHVSPKRPRIGSEKENVFSTLHKGKERARQSPPPSQGSTLCAPDHSFGATESSSVVHSRALQTSRHIAVSRTFTYNHKDHSDLHDVNFCPRHLSYANLAIRKQSRNFSRYMILTTLTSIKYEEAEMNFACVGLLIMTHTLWRDCCTCLSSHHLNSS
jgi:hypothetical protein